MINWIRCRCNALVAGCLIAAVLTVVSAGLGVTIGAAGVGAAAVDEPQYLLTALSLAEDGNLDIADERQQLRYLPFHDQSLPVQTSVLADGRRISPHDPLLPALLALPMAWGGFLAAKWTLVGYAAALSALMVYVGVTRFGVTVPIMTGAATVAGTTAPLAVYAHQVYPELPAGLAALTAVAIIAPRQDQRSGNYWGWRRQLALVAVISILPWLAIKYLLVAAALAAVGGLAMWQTNRRGAYLTGAAAVLSAALWLGAHQWWYGGWTAYATGDHFEERGEFSAVGFAPNYVGRSTRLVGLLVDRDFGLAAWQPAWLLIVPAIAVAIRWRLWVIVAPTIAGWLTAVFIALTMHGYWWPGRQVVVIAPLLVLACAVFLHHTWRLGNRAWMWGAAVLAAIGVSIQVWLTVTGLRQDVTWVHASNHPIPLPYGALRFLLPDYRQFDGTTWVLHLIWTAVCVALLVVFLRRSSPSSTAAKSQKVSL